VISVTGYRLALVGVCLGLCFGAGCKGKSEATAGSQSPAVLAAQKLPEGTNVLAALDQKDYEGAVGALAKLQQSSSEGELAGDYLTLKLYVKNKLIELSATDAKAAEALNALRLLTQGR
jgi:hypothetical protein